MKKLTRTEWTVITVTVIGTSLIVYLILVDPDPNLRRITYHYRVMHSAQWLAEYFGRIGLEAERHYWALVNAERIN